VVGDWLNPPFSSCTDLYQYPAVNLGDAIIENKRLGHALAIIKAQQDLKYVPKVKTNSEKIGYQKRERKSEAVE
jgi:hypothetical protein